MFVFLAVMGCLLVLTCEIIPESSRPKTNGIISLLMSLRMKND